MRNAGVLGRIAQGNRDYTGLVSDLEASLMGASPLLSSLSAPPAASKLTPAEPEVWGYTLSDGQLSPTSDAFTLHLVGMKEQSIEFPPALLASGALKLHEGVSTLEYYRLIGEMVRALCRLSSPRSWQEHSADSRTSSCPRSRTSGTSRSERARACPRRSWRR